MQAAECTRENWVLSYDPRWAHAFNQGGALGTALNYLNGSKEFKGLYGAFQKTGAGIKTTTGPSEFDPKTNTVFWNPTTGLRLSAGVSSSAVGLAHEMSHAVRFSEIGMTQFMTDLVRPIRIDRMAPPDGRGNFIVGIAPEEARATSFVQGISRQLGEPVRSNYHDGDTYNVTSPTFRCFTGPGC